MINKQDAAPYYYCFSVWLSYMRPEVYKIFDGGHLSVDQVEPHVREWAEAITSRDN